MRGVEGQLAWLRRAPLAAGAAILLGTAAMVALASATGAVGIVQAGVTVVGLALASFVAWRVSLVTREVNASIDSLSDSLHALAEGRGPAELTRSTLTSDLEREHAGLAERFAAAERLAKADLLTAQETDGERLAFLADFSHELRTPLNSILGFAHVLDSEVEGALDPDQREAVDIMLASGEQLNALIEDLLDLTALETGRLEIRARPVDLGRIASEVARAASVVASQKKLPVRLEHASSVMAMGDEKRLRRMVWNLVTRAIRATDRGAVVIAVPERATTGPARSTACIKICDDGRPLSTGEQQALMRGTVEEASAREGIGIGLGVVGRLLRLQGGTLSIETGEHGTRLEMTLPAAMNDDISWALDTRPSLIGEEIVDEDKGT